MSDMSDTEIEEVEDHGEVAKPRKSKYDKKRLPQRIIPIPNADKIGWTETWKKGRKPANIPHPFRACLLGNCGVGKSTLAKNLILHQNPPFTKIIVIHCDMETKEYDDLQPTEIIDHVPSPDTWVKNGKTLVIIDDVDFSASGKEEMKNLSRLAGYCSTHKSISLIFCFQEFFHTPKILRRLCNVYVLWRPNDMESLAIIGRKVGLKTSQIREIFDKLLPEKRDSLCIDLSDGTPFPLRKNIFQIIKHK